MKQKSRFGKIVAMLLAVTMLLSMLPISAFAADNLPVTSSTGTWKDIAVGVELFTDKSNCTVKTLPEELAGMKYLHDCMYTDNVASATGDVYIYVLTPDLSMPTYSQQTALEAKGFTAVKTYPVAAITSDLGEPLVVMEKKFSAGDSITLPMWGIILASATKLGEESEPAGFALKELASVETYNAGTTGTVEAGGKIFNDRTNHLFGENIPQWLNGANYFLHNLSAGATAVKVTKAGWLYVLTPVTGGVDTQQAALEAAGFTKVETISATDFTATGSIGDDIAVMAKEVAVGDEVAYGAWGVMLTNATLKVPEIASNNGSVNEIAVGELVFSDKPYKFTSVPEELEGVTYVVAPINGTNVSFNVDGYVYILTPTSAFPDYSQQAAFENAGYELVKEYGVGELSTDLGEALALLGKEITAGESVSLPMWGVVLYSENKLGEEAPEDDTPAITSDNGTVGPFAVGELVFFDRSYKFTTIPEELAGVNYVLAPMNGTIATVNADGYIYVLTPVPAEGSAGMYSQKSALEAAGFNYIKSYAIGALSTDLGESLALMAKKVEKNEKVALAAWGIILYSKTLLDIADAEGEPGEGGEVAPFQFGELAKIEGAGVSVITSGGQMFTDRQHAFHPELPDYLEGVDFVQGPLDGGTRTATVVEAGWVYFLTPTTGVDTQQANLEAAGYETLYVIPAGVIGTTIGEAMAVMGKECEVGEVVHAGQWAIMVAKGDPDYDPDAFALKAPLVQINPTAQDRSYQDGQRTWQGIPSIARDDESGRLWATWYGGDADFPGEGRTNFVVLYTSDDDGATWTGPKVVIDPHYTSPESDMRAFDPNLWVDPDGRMWFIWNQSNGHFDGRGGVWAIYTDNPGAEDPTWSEPARLANGIIMCDPVVLSQPSGDLPAGTWVLPTAIWDGPSTGASDIMNHPDFADERYSNCYVSLDKGMTWTLQGSVLEYEMVRDCDENMIFQQEDGSLKMWIRAKGGIAESTSTDGGKTWTKATNAGVSDVVSRFWVGALDEDTLLAVFNDPPGGGNYRSHMTAALSFDGGETWSKKLTIDSRGGPSYPDVHIGDDGFIYIIYDCGRFNPAALVYMSKITKEDIIAGDLVNEESKLYVLVNNNSVCEVTELALDKTSANINVKEGTTLQLTATVEFSNNTNVDKSYVWSSSDETVATVDQNGLVTAVADGVAVIKVTANSNGKTAECAVAINGYAIMKAEEAAEAAKKEAEEAKAAAEAAKKEAEEAKAKLEAAEKAAEENKAAAEAAKKEAEEAKAKLEAAEKAAEEAKAKQEAAEKALEEALKGEKPEEKPEEPEDKPEEKPVNPFVDIKEDQFCYDAVLWAYENGITTGKDETHFDPSAECTRAQVVTFLWRAAGEPEPKSSEITFPDIAEGKYYTKAVLWAVEEGITNGYKDGTFRPNETCTRGQIVTFLWRYAEEAEAEEEKSFPDVAEGKFYTDAVAWAVENGITSGYKDGTFGPDKTCTRDQIVTFLYRYIVE